MTEPGFLDFQCPYCGNALSFPDTFAGKAQECPTCAETVIVPQDASQPGQRLPLPRTTPRLVLRRLRTSDWKDLLECLSDEELFRHTDGRPLDEGDVVRWLESDEHVRLTTLGQPFCLGMEVQNGGKLIGYLSLTLTGPWRLQADLSVFVSRSYQRSGFATEAVDAALRFCFEAIGLHRVTASCASRNAAGRRLLEKSGLRLEGEFRKDNLLNGEWLDTVLFAMLEEDFRQPKPDLPPS